MAWVSVEKFVEDCRAAAVSGVDAPEKIRGLMEDAVAARDKVLAELPEIDGDDHEIFVDDTLSVFWVYQYPFVGGPPHDHQMDVVIGMLKGVEIQKLYRRVEDRVELVEELALHPGDIKQFSGEAVHAIANPEAERSVALHVYLGNLGKANRMMWNMDGTAIQPFDGDVYSKLEYQVQA